jgi:hypothetical protein
MLDGELPQRLPRMVGSFYIPALGLWHSSHLWSAMSSQSNKTFSLARSGAFAVFRVIAMARAHGGLLSCVSTA